MNKPYPDKASAAGSAYAPFRDGDAALINPDTLNYYCCTNEKLLPPGVHVSGFILEFPGLGGSSCLGGALDNMTSYEHPFTARCAGLGIVVAYMFPGPWSWMARGAVRFADLVVDALMRKYGVDNEADLRLGVMGGSMGGQGALIYAVDSRHRVKVCAAHCPCCDAAASMNVRAEFPRTFVSSVSGYEMPLTEALRLISPAARIDELPDIPYLVTADELDELFPVADTQRMAASMQARGLDVTFMRLPGQPHGGISPEERERLDSFLLRHMII